MGARRQAPAVSTGWQRTSVQLRAVRSGGGPSMAGYAEDLDAGEWFPADDLSPAGAGARATLDGGTWDRPAVLTLFAAAL
jgi:hypothetical protein